MPIGGVGICRQSPAEQFHDPVHTLIVSGNRQSPAGESRKTQRRDGGRGAVEFVLQRDARAKGQPLTISVRLARISVDAPLVRLRNLATQAPFCHLPTGTRSGLVQGLSGQ